MVFGRKAHLVPFPVLLVHFASKKCRTAASGPGEQQNASNNGLVTTLACMQQQLSSSLQLFRPPANRHRIPSHQQKPSIRRGGEAKKHAALYVGIAGGSLDTKRSHPAAHPNTQQHDQNDRPKTDGGPGRMAWMQTSVASAVRDNVQGYGVECHRSDCLAAHGGQGCYWAE